MAQQRVCLREPIAAIVQAAALLDQAVTAHLLGRTDEAEHLISQADMPKVWEWTESILGKKSPHAIPDGSCREPSLPLALRTPARMPSAQEKSWLHTRDGYHCRFCGIPVIRPEIREKIRRVYPRALRWGKRNAERHAAFFALWAQYDHLLPHAKGGSNELSNLVVTCAACNYGRGGYTLGEMGLCNPLDRPPIQSPWDGLERFDRATRRLG